MKKTIILTGILLTCSLIADLMVDANDKGTLIIKTKAMSVAEAIKVQKPPYKDLFDNDLLKQMIISSEVTHIEQENYTVLYKNVKGTVYHPVESQCDDTPLVTADNSKIDTAKINELRWVALSKDLISRKYTNKQKQKIVWSGKIKLGDTIWIDYDKATLWKSTHHGISKSKAAQERADLKYEKLKSKYEQIKGYWIVHDVMGDQYTKRNRKGELIFDENGNKQVVKIHNAIDFLQHPEYGMVDVWDRHIIIAKRKVTKITLPVIAMN